MANSQVLSEEEKKAIDEYSKQIVTLKDNVVAIKKMPGMYAGGVGDRGFLSLIREAYQNCLDQIIDTTSPATYCRMAYNEITHEVLAEDNGKGFPYDKMVNAATALHTSKNYVKVKGQYSSGLHGAGLKVVNALSAECHVSSYRYDGTAMQIDLEEGYLKKGPYNIPNKSKFQGSRVMFTPNTEVLGDITLEWKVIYHLVKDLLSLTPLGSEVIFEAVDISGNKHNERIVNTDGIITRLIAETKSPMCKPIVISDDTGEHKIDIALIFDGGGAEGPDPNPNITAYCNMCPTIAGYHINGVMDGICKWYSQYMNKIYLVNTKNTKNKTVVTISDIKAGLNVMISAACLEPVFIGQAKEQLGNAEMEPFCKDVTNAGLDNWAKTNPQDLNKLCKYFKDIADLRMKDEGNRAKIVTKYTANVFNGMPAKYCKPTESEDDILIVEGDSAAGQAKQARNVKTQGVFPIRGKIISALANPYKKFWENEEAQGIAKIILKKEYTKNYNPDDVKWKKIIFLADADVDGSHIASLLLGFFVVYFPALIQAGKVYKAIPPLYGIENGKNMHYMTGQYEFVNYVKNIFIKTHTVEIDKVVLSQKDLMVLFMTNEDYTYEISTISGTYGVDPKVLEYALFQYHNKTAPAALKKSLKKEFRFMDAEVVQGNVLYTGTTDSSNFLYMNSRLAKDCTKALDIIAKNKSLYYKLDGKECTIYDVMKSFDDLTPTGVQRYKGLGEMDEDQLFNSTLDPNNRILIQYTLEDAKAEIATIKELEADMSKLFAYTGVIKRQDLLD